MEIQQYGTVGRGKGRFNVGPRPLTANSFNANGSVTGLRTRTTDGTGGDAAGSGLAGCCGRPATVVISYPSLSLDLSCGMSSGKLTSCTWLLNWAPALARTGLARARA
jgi:hypothetical protein